jgi:hypothetical protein
MLSKMMKSNKNRDLRYWRDAKEEQRERLMG